MSQRCAIARPLHANEPLVVGKKPEAIVDHELKSLRETGQMEWYLCWLDKHERAAGEETPIGLILCAQTDSEQVELLDVQGSNIRVVDDLAHLPDVKLLREQLHHSVLHAQEQAHAASKRGGKR